MELKTLLDIVLFAMDNDSRIGTPAEFSDDNVRAKFAKQDLVTRSVVRGNCNMVLSYHQSTDDLLDKY